MTCATGKRAQCELTLATANIGQLTHRSSHLLRPALGLASSQRLFGYPQEVRVLGGLHTLRAKRVEGVRRREKV